MAVVGLSTMVATVPIPIIPMDLAAMELPMIEYLLWVTTTTMIRTVGVP